MNKLLPPQSNFIITKAMIGISKQDKSEVKKILSCMGVKTIDELRSKLETFLRGFSNPRIVQINQLFALLGYDLPFILDRECTECEMYKFDIIANNEKDETSYEVLIKKAMKCIRRLNDSCLDLDDEQLVNNEKFRVCIDLLGVQEFSGIEPKLRELIKEQKYRKINALFGFLDQSVPFVQDQSTWYKNF